MLNFIILLIAISIATYFIYNTEKEQKIKSSIKIVITLIIVVCLSASAFIYAQSSYVKNNFLKVSGIVQENVDGETNVRFCDLYEKTGTEELYIINLNSLGFYELTKVELTNPEADVMVVPDGNNIPYNYGVPMYEVKK